MARKNVVRYTLESDSSISASFNTAPTIIQFLDNVSYQINIRTTNSTGTFQIQGSNDYEVDPLSNTVVNAGNWVDISGLAVSVAAANDSAIINMSNLGFFAVRVKYTSTVAGTGKCDIIVVAKQIGG